jgi:GH25 family lysozyme M1 (1,4-beta-N-acetylmuramidase)
MVRKLLYIIILILFLTSLSLADITQWMVDMSSHNSGIEIKNGMTYERNNAEIKLIMHRLTIGRYLVKTDVDKLYSQRSVETNREGIYFGAYHVAYPSSDGKFQAQGFIKALKENTVKNQSVMLALDWEHVCVKWNYNEKGQKQSCSEEGILPPSWVLEFLDETKKLTNVTPLVYTSPRVLKEFKKYFDLNPKICEKLTLYPLWLARYYNKTGFSFPTNEEIFPWSDWTFWQFSEGKGDGPTKKISPKIKNFPIDSNFYNGSRQDINSFVAMYLWRVQ